MTKPLSTLLGDARMFFQSHWQAILVGAVVFGLLQAGVQAQMQRKAMNSVGTIMGIDAGKFQELSKRVARGDEAAMKELQKMGENRMESLGGAEEARQAAMTAIGMDVLGNMLPVIGMSVLIMTLINMLTMSYFGVVAVRGMSDAMSAFKQSFGLIIPLLGLWIWIFLRSFMWIPFIGIIFAIILGPRFVAAPVLLIRDGKGIMESAGESYARTSGYWGKIFGNMLVVGIVMVIAMMIITNILNMFFSSYSVWVTMIIQQLATAFCVIFAVQLAKTILEQPKTTI